MAFYVGQKVVCVDAGLSKITGKAASNLREGSVYTVIGAYTSKLGNPGIIVSEAAPNSETARGFLTSRFRPIVERKTSIEIFKAMLNPSKTEVEA